MKQMTVDELLVLCMEQHKNGNGDKFIVISDDNEGNGYHGLFYGFTKIYKEEADFFLIYDSQETDTEKILILG